MKRIISTIYMNCFNFWTQLKGELSRLTKLNLHLQEQLICQTEAARTPTQQCTKNTMKKDGRKDAPENIQPTVDGVSQRIFTEFFAYCKRILCVIEL